MRCVVFAKSFAVRGGRVAESEGGGGSSRLLIAEEAASRPSGSVGRAIVSPIALACIHSDGGFEGGVLGILFG